LQTDIVPTDVETYVKLKEEGKISLSHKFGEKQLYETLQTTSSEGSMISLDIMIYWKVTDAEIACK